MYANTCARAYVCMYEVDIYVHTSIHIIILYTCDVLIIIIIAHPATLLYYYSTLIIKKQSCKNAIKKYCGRSACSVTLLLLLYYIKVLPYGSMLCYLTIITR